MPDGLRPAEEPVPGRGGDQRTAGRHLPRKDGDGRRPVNGGQPILQNDPHWRDLVLFYEYYHGDNGAGIRASHQTGWSGTVGVLPLLFRGAWFRERGGQIPAQRPAKRRKRWRLTR